MKKETAILAIVIAFLVGFVSGATIAILRTTQGAQKTAAVQTPSMGQEMEPPPVPQGLPDTEAAGRIQALKDLVKKEPKNSAAWGELGNLYFDMNKAQEAIEAYGQSLAIKPDNPDVRTDMGIMYRKLGNPDQALKEFRRAAQGDPKHVNSRYNIGIVLLHDKQDIKGAIEAWEEYLKVDPKGERPDRVRSQMEKLRGMAK